MRCRDAIFAERVFFSVKGGYGFLRCAYVNWDICFLFSAVRIDFNFSIKLSSFKLFSCVFFFVLRKEKTMPSLFLFSVKVKII